MVCSVSLLKINYAPRKIAQCLTMGRQMVGITYHIFQRRNGGGHVGYGADKRTILLTATKRDTDLDHLSPDKTPGHIDQGPGTF